ncbi:hypothetical protein U0070_001186 [Myodes glareolus]|uniref:Uncharacterized protein n=1 Tax=Myodes glareolus TaxID=447135 RepID=A0AAW0HES1_MYOGA
MQNNMGEFMDLYVPWKYTTINLIIGPKDRASIQMNVAEVDRVTGQFNGQFKTYTISGAILMMGFLCVTALAAHSVDQAGLRVTEIRLPQSPEC